MAKKVEVSQMSADEWINKISISIQGNIWPQKGNTMDELRKRFAK